jgi:hypothetical protein
MTVNHFRQIIAHPKALCTTGQIRTNPKNHQTTKCPSQRAQQQPMIHSIESLYKLHRPGARPPFHSRQN